MHFLGKPVVGDRDGLGRAFDVGGDEVDQRAIDELDGAAAREAPGPDLRPAQVGEDGDVAPGAGCDLSNAGDDVDVVFARTVREVDAGDVEARVNECAKALRR